MYCRVGAISNESVWMASHEAYVFSRFEIDLLERRWQLGSATEIESAKLQPFRRCSELSAWLGGSSHPSGSPLKRAEAKSLGFQVLHILPTAEAVGY